MNIRVNCKNNYPCNNNYYLKNFFVRRVVLIFSLVRTAFFFKHIVRLLAWYIKFEKRQALKKESGEELLLAHPKRWWNFFMRKDEKKEIEPIFTE